MGTDLRGTTLTRTKLEEALYDELTLWPDAFDADAAGALFIGPKSNLSGKDLSERFFDAAKLQGQT